MLKQMNISNLTGPVILFYDENALYHYSQYDFDGMDNEDTLIELQEYIKENGSTSGWKHHNRS